MEAFPNALTRASSAALDALSGAATRVAAGAASGAVERSMAGAARTAIFADALLGAMRARLEELKTVAK